MKTYREPVVFMHYWLNYYDKNHTEKIPIRVKDIDHLFYMASEIIDADKLHLFFYFLTVLELMIMNT